MKQNYAYKMTNSQFNSLISKVQRSLDVYRNRYLVKNLAELACEYYETAEHLTSPSEVPEWKPIANGTQWGGNFMYAWFKTRFIIPKELEGKKLWLENRSQCVEALVFKNGIPSGMFDVCDDMTHGNEKLHRYFLITENAKAGESFDFALEGYAGNFTPGNHPFMSQGDAYPARQIREFRGMRIVSLNEKLEEFLIDLNLTIQLYRFLEDSNEIKWQAANAIEEIYALLPQKPEYYDDGFIFEQIDKCSEIINKLKSRKKEPAEFPLIGICGHSHLDTAWLWPVEETKRKAARTFSNALNLMERYPNYSFMQSSVLYLDWMKKYYPAVFEEIKRRTASGQWQPNGGSWVEPDCNIPSGESLIRQFLRGQLFLRDELGYHADTFWLPDTFGYSAAIPQILNGFGMKYFLTTKLSWNDTTGFPYDSFIWRGIDGSEVITHLNLTHKPANVDHVLGAARGVTNKRLCNRKLLTYGYGDGGGGPHYGMVETAERTKEMPGLPRVEECTVSEFMQGVEQDRDKLNTYFGELYVELHRGTLTQFHDLKRLNRRSEILLHDLEAVSSVNSILFGKPYNDKISGYYDTVLLNQFHDILPGTAIDRAMDIARDELASVAEGVEKQIRAEIKSVSKPADSVTFFNSLSFERKTQFSVPDIGVYPSDCLTERFEDVEGNKMLAVKTVLKPLGYTTESAGVPESAQSVFSYSGDVLETPFATVTFDSNGYISSLFDKTAKREVAANPHNEALPLGGLYAGDDIPSDWDDWDINFDQRFKMELQTKLTSRQVVLAGALQFRIRSSYQVGRESSLTQDMIFYSDTPRIDFETVVDWRENHTLLKASFPLNILTTAAKTETQFGYIERQTYRNNDFEKAKFEVCNHKWTDISETNFGAAVLNDCKYGISIEDSTLSLTLHKSGNHPAAKGDQGRHRFTYSLLPHAGAFSAEAVVQPAFELNTAPYIAVGKVGSGDTVSIAKVLKENVIIDTVKSAENGKGYIFRLYECERALTDVNISFGFSFKKVYETNMMEDIITELKPQEDKSVNLTVKPFEIKTLLVEI